MTNEHADLLRKHLGKATFRAGDFYDTAATTVLDEALAAERRATVERIREAIETHEWFGGNADSLMNDIRTILAEEAAR